jgi:hypothetical protein
MRLESQGPDLVRSRTKEVSVAKAAEVVEKYQRAFGSGHVQTARSLLADDLHFKGRSRSSTTQMRSCSRWPNWRRSSPART